VLLIGPLLPSGGVTRYVKDLLSSSGRYEFAVFNAARVPKNRIRPGTGYSTLLNAGLVRAIRGALTTLAHMVVFPWAVHRSAASIVHVCGVSYWPFWENAYYILVSKLARRGVTLHYLGALDLYYCTRGRLERALVSMVLRWPDRIILLSDRAHQLAASFVPSERLSVIPSNVDVSKFGPHEHAPVHEDGAIRVLFIGGMDPFRKGVLELLEAAAIVIKSNRNVRFVMSGGDCFQEVERRWSRMGLDTYIEFLGWIPEDQKARVYQSADMLVLPSHNEGLPYVIVEALASGLPVIASSVGGIPEAVVHGENGYIVEPGDAESLAACILALAGDADLRRAMGERNRRLAAEHYSTEGAIARLESLFDEVLVE